LITKQLREILKRLATLVDHSDSKLRKLAFDCLQIVVETVQEDYEMILKHYFGGMRDFLDKELRAVCKKAKKRRALVNLFESEGGPIKHHGINNDANRPMEGVNQPSSLP
jgi:uncharacterized protein YeeX (DUF496 family)